MFWCGIYLLVSAAVATTVFVIANWFRPGNAVPPDHPGTVSAVAGALWPVLVVGMTELAVVRWLSRNARYHQIRDLQLIPFG